MLCFTLAIAPESHDAEDFLRILAIHHLPHRSILSREVYISIMRHTAFRLYQQFGEDVYSRYFDWMSKVQNLHDFQRLTCEGFYLAFYPKRHNPYNGRPEVGPMTPILPYEIDPDVMAYISLRTKNLHVRLKNFRESLPHRDAFDVDNQEDYPDFRKDL